MAQNASLVGIDVSKAKLDWCIRGVACGTAANSVRECTALAKELVGGGIRLAVLEASGGYERTMVAALRKLNVGVMVISPKRVRDFAKAAGRRAKNDPIDADTIAWFGEIFVREGGALPDPVREQLPALVAERQDFIGLRTECLNRNEHKAPALCQRLRKATLKILERAIAELDAAIAALIGKTPHLAACGRLLASVPCLGRQAVAALLAWLPELGEISDARIAALVGVAPFDDDSGTHKGVRRIAGGRRQLRNILYMAVLGGATQYNATLKTFYQRLLAKGKLKKVALIACLRKLLTIINVMVARGESWDPPSCASRASA